MSRWRRYFRAGTPDLRADVDDELRFHVEMGARDLVAAGMSREAARVEAERRFGTVEAVRDACLTIDRRRQRRSGQREVIGDMWKDVRFAFRGLRRTPGFTLTAVLCVALGVCVTTTIFSAVNSILIRPLPYAHPDELVAVYAQYPERGAHGVNISTPDYASWRDENHTFAQLGMWTWSSHALSGTREAERVDGASVTANLFPLLGVRPLIGRTFLESEQRAGADREILLGYGVWQARFGGDRSIVGRTITVDGVPYSVVGVMPAGFNFPDRGEVWVPFVVDAAEGRGNRQYAGAIGRLKPGVTLDQARADLASISARLQHEYPQDNFGWLAEAITLREDLTGDLRKPLLVFLGAVAFVLLIACANVANLMLARGAARHRELAIRAAMGAGQGRLVRQLLTESMVIALAGGALGTVVAFGGVRLLRLAFPADVPFYIMLGLDHTALLFALGVAVLTGVLFGTVPAMRTSRVNLASSLGEGSRGSSEGLGKSALRSALVVAEIALSLMLMVGAMLLIRSYRALEGTDLGFEEHGVLSARLSLPEAKYTSRSMSGAFYQQLLERVVALPGVEAAGTAQGIPFSGWNIQGGMAVEGHPPRKQGDDLIVHFQWISADYFRTIGVPIVRGRGLTGADRDSLAPVGVINETLAKREFRGEDPIGKRISWARPGPGRVWVTIVGVARDFRHYRLPQPMGPALYLSYAALPLLTQTLVVRTRLGDPAALVPAITAAVRQLDPDVPLYMVQSLDQVVSRSLWRQRLQGEVLGVFAALALLLALVGIYGVISYGVAQRTRELGVRMALGATQHDVLALVLKQGTRLALVGIAVGMAGALALTHVVASLLYGVGPRDPRTFVGVAAMLGAVALLASYLPARRATRIDPLVAMRAE